MNGTPGVSSLNISKPWPCIVICLKRGHLCRSSSNPRNPTDRLAAAPSPFSNTPFSRALSVQHASTTINYGGIGALPLYKAKSCNVDTIQDSPKVSLWNYRSTRMCRQMSPL